MKRNDILTTLVGVALTGLSWHFGGIKWGLPIAVASAVAFFLIHSYWKEPSPVGTQPSISDSLKQNIENVGNPVQNANPTINNSPTFNNNPIFAPQIHVTPPTIPAAPAVKPVQPKQQSKHNIVFLRAEFVKLTYSGPGFSSSTDGMHSFSEVTGTSKGDMIGLVARFRNEAIFGQEIRPVRGARAHLKLFDKNNQEIGTGFSAALWLGHQDDTFDLIPNGHGGSVLVCWGTKTKAMVSWKTRRAVDRLLRDNEIEIDNGYPRKAEVTILDSTDRPLLEPVILEITKASGELSVATRP